MSLFAVTWSSVKCTRVYSPLYGKEVEMHMCKNIKFLTWKKASSIPLPKELCGITYVKSVRISESFEIDTLPVAVNAPLWQEEADKIFMLTFFFQILKQVTLLPEILGWSPFTDLIQLLEIKLLICKFFPNKYAKRGSQHYKHITQCWEPLVVELYCKTWLQQSSVQRSF